MSNIIFKYSLPLLRLLNANQLLYYNGVVKDHILPVIFLNSLPVPGISPPKIKYRDA